MSEDWIPSEEDFLTSNIYKFAPAPLQGKEGLSLWKDSPQEWYRTLHQWSTQHTGEFWAKVWKYVGIVGAIGDDNDDNDSERNLSFRTSDKYYFLPPKADCPLSEARFFPFARVNLAENLLRLAKHPSLKSKLALVVISELNIVPRYELTYKQMFNVVASLQKELRDVYGIQKGDRVAGILPNTPAAILYMLATVSLGAIWTCVAPESGPQVALDRVGRIGPKILIAVDDYVYNGMVLSCKSTISAICKAKSCQNCPLVIIVPYLKASNDNEFDDPIEMAKNQDVDDGAIFFEPMNFNDPVYILYTSGTTGLPKCIVQGFGVHLNHMKEHIIQQELTDKDVCFGYTTTQWMLWQYLTSLLHVGVTLILYDGSPTPKGDAIFLWKILSQEKVSMFMTGARMLDVAAANNGDAIVKNPSLNLQNLKEILSTASPLSETAACWVLHTLRQKADPHVRIHNVSGGTEINGALVCCTKVLPITKNQLQCPPLGMDTDVLDDDGVRVPSGVQGELVCFSPFPSMPLYFYGEGDAKAKGMDRYRETYFEKFLPSIWAHGDIAERTSDQLGFHIRGRSDSTLNPGGVRLGTSEYYQLLKNIPSIADAIIVDVQNKGVILFIVERSPPSSSSDETNNKKNSDTVITKVKTLILNQLSSKHVPAEVIFVPVIPYNRNMKKMEVLVKMILEGRTENSWKKMVPNLLDESMVKPYVDVYNQWTKKQKIPTVERNINTVSSEEGESLVMCDQQQKMEKSVSGQGNDGCYNISKEEVSSRILEAASRVLGIPSQQLKGMYFDAPLHMDSLSLVLFHSHLEELLSPSASTTFCCCENLLPSVVELSVQFRTLHDVDAFIQEKILQHHHHHHRKEEVQNNFQQRRQRAAAAEKGVEEETKNQFRRENEVQTLPTEEEHCYSSTPKIGEMFFSAEEAVQYVQDELHVQLALSSVAANDISQTEGDGKEIKRRHQEHEEKKSQASKVNNSLHERRSADMPPHQRFQMLHEIAVAFLKLVPFQSISSLVSLHQHHHNKNQHLHHPLKKREGVEKEQKGEEGEEKQGRNLPTLLEIKNFVFSRQGGLCYVLNIFMGHLLQALGFDVYFGRCTIHGVEDCHVTVFIRNLEVTVSTEECNCSCAGECSHQLSDEENANKEKGAARIEKGKVEKCPHDIYQLDVGCGYVLPFPIRLYPSFSLPSSSTIDDQESEPLRDPAAGTRTSPHGIDDSIFRMSEPQEGSVIYQYGFLKVKYVLCFPHYLLPIHSQVLRQKEGKEGNQQQRKGVCCSWKDVIIHRLHADESTADARELQINNSSHGHHSSEVSDDEEGFHHEFWRMKLTPSTPYYSSDSLQTKSYLQYSKLRAGILTDKLPIFSAGSSSCCASLSGVEVGNKGEKEKKKEGKGGMGDRMVYFKIDPVKEKLSQIELKSDDVDHNHKDVNSCMHDDNVLNEKGKRSEEELQPLRNSPSSPSSDDDESSKLECQVMEDVGGKMIVRSVTSLSQMEEELCYYFPMLKREEIVCALNVVAGKSGGERK